MFLHEGLQNFHIFPHGTENSQGPQENGDLLPDQAGYDLLALIRMHDEPALFMWDRQLMSGKAKGRCRGDFEGLHECFRAVW
jgi:hypothetical protein